MYAIPYPLRLSLLAALICTGLAAPRVAFGEEEKPAEPPDEYEEVEVGPVEFVFGEPGQLTIDASDGKSAFPTLLESLHFDDWKQFGLFLEEYFNAKVTIHDEVTPPEVELDYVVLGTPLVADPETDTLYEVEDPIAEFVGGPDGWIYVHGEPYCFNQRLCGDPEGMPEEGRQAAAAQRSAAIQALGLRPLPWPVFGPFRIEGTSGRTAHLYVPWFWPWSLHWHYWSKTTQVSGGYQIWLVSGSILRRPICTFLPRSGVPICYSEPFFIIRRVGKNVLYAEMRAVDYDPYWRCQWERFAAVASATNVRSVTAGRVYWGYRDFWYLRPGGILGKHFGWDPVTLESDDDISSWGAADWSIPSCW